MIVARSGLSLNLQGGKGSLICTLRNIILRSNDFARDPLAAWLGVEGLNSISGHRSF